MAGDDVEPAQHRKLLAVDGQTAFTGGMNIRHGNVLTGRSSHPVQDLQFRVEGPVVTQLQAVFANDWAFTTGEMLHGDAWFPESGLPDRVSLRGSSPTDRTPILKNCA